MLSKSYGLAFGFLPALLVPFCKRVFAFATGLKGKHAMAVVGALLVSHLTSRRAAWMGLDGACLLRSAVDVGSARGPTVWYREYVGRASRGGSAGM